MPERRQDEEIDVALSQRARLGDPRAWRTLIRRHTPMVYRLAARMLGPGAEAEDACQEAFMQAHQSFDGYDTARPLAPWLGRITYHVCLKRLAKLQRLRLVDVDDALEHLAPDSADDPERETSQRQLGAQLETAMQHLSAQDRALVTLRYLDGLTDAEVGDAVGMNRHTVRTRLHRARMLLMRVLAPMLGGRPQ
jgi:RNA polymerase sigma-70 factor (ECF subfamily)